MNEQASHGALPAAEPIDPGTEAGAAPPRQRVLKPLGALVLAAVGIGAIAWALSFGVGTLQRPGAGLWPLTLGAALTVGSVIFVVFNRDGKEGAFGREQLHALLAVGSILAFILLFQYVHFIVASLVLLTGCQLAAGARKPLQIALTCVLATAAAWVLFFVILGVSAPL
ncbi:MULTISPECIES: tripartite tricarboxylate transporter TctB family protein [unclassified Brachybacterium]|uniref:tripartite tricarboxylate transporter TctB family protein n=1 Tax=unclassified Brachybacterium TaxID=2623841 RepID=UPI0036171494